MARFFAKEQGARVMVQGYGEATADKSVEVPESVAAELRKHPGLAEPEPVKPKETPKRNPSPAKGEKE